MDKKKAREATAARASHTARTATRAQARRLPSARRCPLPARKVPMRSTDPRRSSPTSCAGFKHPGRRRDRQLPPRPCACASCPARKASDALGPVGGGGLGGQARRAARARGQRSSSMGVPRLKLRGRQVVTRRTTERTRSRRGDEDGKAVRPQRAAARSQNSGFKSTPDPVSVTPMHTTGETQQDLEARILLAQQVLGKPRGGRTTTTGGGNGSCRCRTRCYARCRGCPLVSDTTCFTADDAGAACDDDGRRSRWT